MRVVSTLNYSLDISENFIYFDRNLINDGELFETIPPEFYLNPFVNELVNEIRNNENEIDYFLYFDKASKKEPNNKKNLLISINKSSEILNWENLDKEFYELNKSFKLNTNTFLSVNYKTQSKNLKKFKNAIELFDEFFNTIEEVNYFPKANFNIFGDPATLQKNKERYEAYKKTKDDKQQLRLLEANEKYGNNMTKSKNSFSSSSSNSNKSSLKSSYDSNKYYKCYAEMTDAHKNRGFHDLNREASILTKETVCKAYASGEISNYEGKR